MGIWVTSTGQELPFPRRLAADLFEIGQRDSLVYWKDVRKLFNVWHGWAEVIFWNELDRSEQEVLRECLNFYVTRLEERCTKIGYSDFDAVRTIFDNILLDIAPK